MYRETEAQDPVRQTLRRGRGASQAVAPPPVLHTRSAAAGSADEAVTGLDMLSQEPCGASHGRNLESGQAFHGHGEPLRALLPLASGAYSRRQKVQTSDLW